MKEVMYSIILKCFHCIYNSVTVHYPAYYVTTYQINIDLSFNYFSMSDGDIKLAHSCHK